MGWIGGGVCCAKLFLGDGTRGWERQTEASCVSTKPGTSREGKTPTRHAGAKVSDTKEGIYVNRSGGRGYLRI